MNLKTKISVDGFVNPKTIPDMLLAGSDILVLGSTGLFRNDMNVHNALNEVKESIDKVR